MTHYLIKDSKKFVPLHKESYSCARNEKMMMTACEDRYLLWAVYVREQYNSIVKQQ